MTLVLTVCPTCGYLPQECFCNMPLPLPKGETRVTGKVAGVVLDDWKLPTFKKHLDVAGYKYEEPTQFTAGTLTLRVHYEWVHKLKPIIEAAQRECAETRRTRQ